MKAFLINYLFPKEYRGSYIAYGNDSIEAGTKVATWLKETYGDTSSVCSSMIVEIQPLIKIIG